MAEFNEECTGCGACAAVCPFLAEYGTPDLILRERPEASFYCTSCGKCSAVCPLDLSPAAAFFEVKQRLVQEGQVPLPARRVLDGARGFAKTGHGFPFTFYGSKDTVFWPGCGLAANRPGLAREIRKILSSRLKKQVGLVLDCCYDPVYGLGDTATACAALQDINKRLRDGGVTKVITGCLNCHKLLSQHLEDIEVVFILELLPPDLFEKQGQGPMYLHHPCPSARWEETRGAARRLFNYLTGTNLQASPPAGAVPITGTSDAQCCGAGGGLCSSAPELADRFLDRIVGEGGGRTMVTYCVGCQNRFLKRGVEAVHLLECLPGITPRRKAPSPLGQWFNRLSLAITERLKTGKSLAVVIIALLIGGGIYLNEINVFSETLLILSLCYSPSPCGRFSGRSGRTKRRRFLINPVKRTKQNKEI
ncbi:MAG TPA: hypothetical protein DCG53_03905 [Syntrophus sp. (in: bacteria)]|nr:hypothetical protein [Syntrophus sp. (in: bacteria)]